MGNKKFVGAYQTCGAPQMLPFTVSNKELGNAVFYELLQIDKYTEKDNNPDFYKALCGMASNKAFVQKMKLIFVWSHGTNFEIKGSKQVNGHYVGVPRLHIELPIEATAEDIGCQIRILMEQMEGM